MRIAVDDSRAEIPIVIEFVVRMRVIREHSMLIRILIAARHRRSPRRAEVDIGFFAERLESAQARDLLTVAIAAHEVIP